MQTALRFATLSSVLGTLAALWAGATPGVGDTAPDFTLPRAAAGGSPVSLAEAVAARPTALIVLRGFPGYQCPFCNRQVQDLIRNAKDLRSLRVILVYPGPSAGVDAKAKEFMAGRELPGNFEFLVDPDYKMTELYGLRWNQPGETAYPSTFLIDTHGKISFAKVSREHGGRTSAAEIVKAARQLANK